MELLDQIFAGQAYEFRSFARAGEIQRYYEQCRQPLILDCGANIGASAVWFATRFPKATVVAVEPEPGNFAVLKQNAHSPALHAIHGAVASAPGRLGVLDPGLGTAGFRTTISQTPGALFEVRAYTLQELLQLVPDAIPFILKVDIEGAEADLFGGDQEILDLFPVVIVELHDWMLPGSASSRKFLQWHTRHERDLVQAGENSWSLCNRMLPARNEKA
jgi:FkbM family methyltransferase